MGPKHAEDLDLETAQDLARWLEESGRRKRGAVFSPNVPKQVRAAPRRTKRARYLTQPSLLYLFGVATVAYFVYYFAGVNVEIFSMRSLLVFIAA